MSLTAAAAAAVVVVGLPVSSSAQSLADVAKAEQARRKDVPTHGKVYTNVDLRPDHTTPTPGAASTGVGTTADEPATADASEAPAEGAPAGGARDEKYWRDRITAARAERERSQTFADALQSRIDALTLDFVNRDDPAQRSVVEQNRLKALAELERVQRDIAAHTKAISDIEDEARRANVPAGWLR